MLRTKIHVHAWLIQFDYKTWPRDWCAKFTPELAYSGSVRLQYAVCEREAYVPREMDMVLTETNEI